MTSNSIVLGLPFGITMMLAAIWDVRARRIPNALTLAAAAAAPVLWGILEGPGAALTSLLGGGVGLLVGLAFFALGAMGAGDSKLLMVMGAFLGPTRFLTALVITGIAGAILALATAVAKGRLLPALAGAWQVTLYLSTLGRKGARRTIESPGSITIPYGVVIAAGGLVTWFVVPWPWS